MNAKILSVLLLFLLILPQSIAIENNTPIQQEEVNETGEALNPSDNTTKDFVVLSWRDKNNLRDCLSLLYVDPDLNLEIPVRDESETDADYSNTLSQWSLSKLNYGILHVCKADDSERLGFMYDGVNGVLNSSDNRYYTSLTLTYPGETEGQLKATQTLDNQTTVAYANFYCEDGFNTIRIEWTADEDGNSTWSVSKFDADSIETASDAEIAARFGYFEADENYIVSIGTDSVNVREDPNGEIIGRLVDGSQITRFDFEMMSETQGLPFTLIAKYSVADSEGVKRLEYYGWAASKFIPEQQSEEGTAYDENE